MKRAKAADAGKSWPHLRIYELPRPTARDRIIETLGKLQSDAPVDSWARKDAAYYLRLLLQNALAVTDGKAPVVVRTRRDPDRLFLTVEDAGPPLGPDQLRLRSQERFLELAAQHSARMKDLQPIPEPADPRTVSPRRVRKRQTK